MPVHFKVSFGDGDRLSSSAFAASSAGAAVAEDKARGLHSTLSGSSKILMLSMIRIFMFTIAVCSTMDQILFAWSYDSIKSICKMRIMITLLRARWAVILKLYLILLSAKIWSSKCPPGPFYALNYGHVCRRATMPYFAIYEIPLAEAEVIINFVSQLFYMFVPIGI